MDTNVSTTDPAANAGSDLRLARWTASMGSKTNSRGAVLIESGSHRWQASAKGNGLVDALFRAVDLALVDVLGGHPRLLSYDVHALAEGPDAEARVTVQVAPPADAPADRRSGTFEGVAQGANIVVASIEAYIGAIERFLSEDQWAGAIEAAGNNRAVPVAAEDPTNFDEKIDPDHSRWWA